MEDMQVDFRHCFFFLLDSCSYWNAVQYFNWLFQSKVCETLFLTIKHLNFMQIMESTYTNILKIGKSAIQWKTRGAQFLKDIVQRWLDHIYWQLMLTVSVSCLFNLYALCYSLCSAINGYAILFISALKTAYLQ